QANDPLYAGIVPTTETLKLDDVRLVTPVLPRSKVIGVVRNWEAHAEELGNEIPTTPLLFFKPTPRLLGPMSRSCCRTGPNKSPTRQNWPSSSVASPKMFPSTARTK